MTGNKEIIETQPDTIRSREPIELAGLLRGKMSCRISRETLKRRWIESSQKHHGQEPSHASATKPGLVRDKLFSPQPGKTNESNPEQGKRIQQTPATSRSNLDVEQLISSPTYEFGSRRNFFNSPDRRSPDPLFTIVGQIHDTAVLNDLTNVESILSQASPPMERLLEAAAKAEKGIETLRALFILRGDQITNTRQLVRIAAENESHGADMLELFLLLRGDQMTTADMEDILTAAAANEEQGRAIIDLILDRYGDQIRLTGKVAKAMVANRTDGMELMEVLLNRYGDQMTMTDMEDTFKAIIAHSSLDMKVRVSILLLRIAITKHESCETFLKLLRETDNAITGSVNSFSWKMLSCAAHSKENEVFKLILEKSQVEDDLKDIDELGWTPLFWAIYEGDEDVVKALVDTGKVNIKNIEEKHRRNQKAFSWAAELGREKIVEQLLRIDGIQVDSKDDKYGRTPLLWAAKEGQVRVVQVLIEKCKVDVNAKDRDGRTAFGYAKENNLKNYAGIMQLLQE
ncbi:hypothetical protein Daus18300_001894 [Diaporthe australafricana]|uniref:Ankyrin repeat protein n=1 Tax=Diaporthe australafricana TaxID=127596 RepID=A0ABR3XUT9_9PEZI